MRTRKRSAMLQSRHLKLIDAALDLQQAGEQERALEIFLTVREEVPDYAPIHLLLGLAYQNLGHTDEAEVSLRQALKLEPEYPEALQALGLFLSAKGKWAEAVELLKRHLEHNPKDPVSLKAVSVALLRLGREKEAIRVLQESWQKTGAEEPGVQFGRLLIQLNHWPQAEAVLREVAEKITSPRTLSEWALALTLLRRYEEACRPLERAVERDPSFDRAWRGLAYCYDRMGRLERALEAADRALALDNHHYRNWQAKGDVLLSLGEYEEALNAAQRGIELIAPDDEEARPVLYELLRQQFEALVGLGRVEDALEHLEGARRRFPTEERFPRLQALLLTHLDKYEEALRVLEEARKAGIPHESNLAPLHYEVLHVLGRPDEAWAAVRSQLDEDRERRLHLLGDVGVSLYVRGYVGPARAIFEQLHRFAPDIPRFSSNLGFLSVGEGKLAEAESYFQEALETPESEDWRLLILCNLGYLHLLEGKYEQAEQALQEAEQRIGDAGDMAILRVAYWCAGKILPYYVAHPRRSRPIRLAVKANQAALRLAQGRTDEAEALARQIVEEEPDISLGYTILGSVLLAKALPDEAREAWEQALECAEAPEEREMLTQWLEGLAR